MQCIAPVCVLAIVAIGLLIMVRAITLEEAVTFAGRILLLVFVLMWLISVLRGVLLAALPTVLAALGGLAAWLVILCFALMLLLLAARRMRGRVGRSSVRRDHRDGGDA